jgi:phosphate starvation-inducible PhoH-like protein
MIDLGIIEICPLAFMRGRTLNNSFVILDEAQNTTIAQMKMFLTRLGEGSKAVITGDITQIDLEKNITSGLVKIQQILAGLKGIVFIYLSSKDVVRHRLVQDIIDAYARYENKLKGRKGQA